MGNDVLGSIGVWSLGFRFQGLVQGSGFGVYDLGSRFGFSQVLKVWRGHGDA